VRDIVCWWSGGVTSAVACYLSIRLFGLENCKIIFIDTNNEDEDTYRFKKDCSNWYGKQIETISSIPHKYGSIQDVWRKHGQLSTANGAICSYKLKRVARERWEKENEWEHQVFGFEFERKELNRAKSLKLNHGHTKPIFPLLMYGLDKIDCIDIVRKKGLEIPRAYSLGFQNNNCLKTGCIEGGVGYWQKMKRDFPEKFNKMAMMEHELTNKRGYQVTMLRDQSKEAKTKSIKDQLVFLSPHPSYPQNKHIGELKGREIKPLNECNGFCGVNDLNERSKTINELNLEKMDEE